MHIQPFNNSDDELVKMLKEGSEQAFCLIYKKYAQNLYNACYNLTRNKAESEDTIQELFSDLWFKRSTFMVKSSLKGYLYTAARNRMITKIRSYKLTVDLAEIAALSGKQSADDFVIEKELKLKLHTEIASLPAKCAEIYILSRHEQLSNKEIANQLNLSVKTVENQITIAIRRLRISMVDFLGILLVILFFK